MEDESFNLKEGISQMTGIGLAQIALYLFIILLCVKPLGWYMAQIYAGKPCGINRLLRPIEKLIYRVFCAF